ncbi:ACP S-malonyltransferase [Micromonospora inyonensis]|uniref:Malonyl CoA-acyl carrier protein transacylase n=1 Tax=Micromonospora inyonensis TaxID=47866 RepID=A0A1C6RLH4_9ACTN|nr:ACP S-malonyltransferase [Micromonospora inyonensis]SCL18010.1 [acyl-carrier-protein] S-malonyltransferase [Micromonospora inyonensis]
MTPQSIVEPYAVLFPGQGAQFPGMAQRWHDEVPAVRKLFSEAEALAGLPLRELLLTMARDAQVRTDWTQPCVFVASLAGWIALRERLARTGTGQPAYLLGHSLGHFTALVASGAVDLDAGLRLVRQRGEIMHRSGQRSPGEMLTVVGLPADEIAAMLEGEHGRKVYVAAVNGPDQVVLSGDRPGIAWAEATALARGAARTVPLAIGIAAHSPLMAEAQTEFAAELANLVIHPPRTPVVLNTTARPSTDPSAIRADLQLHMLEPVRWWESIRSLRDTGVQRFVDVGPGRTLCKVLSRYLPPEELLANDRRGGLEVLAR